MMCEILRETSRNKVIKTLNSVPHPEKREKLRGGSRFSRKNSLKLLTKTINNSLSLLGGSTAGFKGSPTPTNGSYPPAAVFKP
jgi:hypothetical protein